MQKIVIALVLSLVALSSVAATGEAPHSFDGLPEWVTILFGVLYALSHAVAVLPASIKQVLPDWLINLLNLFAANYGSAKNRDD